MTRSTAAASARFRQRKLSTRQTLQILKEDQVDSVDDEAQRNVTKVETGVEKGEEIVSPGSGLVIRHPAAVKRCFVHSVHAVHHSPIRTDCEHV